MVEDLVKDVDFVKTRIQFEQLKMNSDIVQLVRGCFFIYPDPF
jgi:hypothetical protein